MGRTTLITVAFNAGLSVMVARAHTPFPRREFARAIIKSTVAAGLSAVGHTCRYRSSKGLSVSRFGRSQWRPVLQMLDAFSDVEFGDRLNLECFQGAYHVFTSEKDRVRLYDIVLNWMTTTQVRPARTVNL
jgi:hypothetical protein